MNRHSGNMEAVDALAKVEVGQHGGDRKSEEIKVGITNLEKNDAACANRLHVEPEKVETEVQRRAKEAMPLADVGRPENGSNQNGFSGKRGENAEYLTARIARDPLMDYVNPATSQDLHNLGAIEHKAEGTRHLGNVQEVSRHE